MAVISDPSRGAKRQIGPGPDQIHDGFGLRHIHLAIQESALGKLAWLRHARAAVKTRFEDARRDENSTVTTDLDQIFPGITGRRAMDREHDLIDHALGFDDLTQPLRVRRELRGLFFAAVNAIGQPDRVLARNADQRDGAFARGSGDRRDGFAGDRTLLGVHHLGSSLKISRSAATQRRFCSIVPTEIRIHSGRL